MLRTCIGCERVDDHPRHVIGDGGGPGVDIFWHHDCHAIATGDEVSAAVAESGLKGDELRKHILANDPGGEVARRRNEQHLENARRVVEQSQEA